jgi:Rieske Fe-S protein
VKGRRRFCEEACRAVLGAAFVAIPWPHARAQDGSRPLPTVKGEVADRRVRVGVASTPLAEAGGVARVVSTVGSFLVTRSGDREFLVFSAICSHESCIITEGDDEAFVCPCHGSRFDRRGNVLTRPAELPLYAQVSTFADDVLTISL